jgi:hypothetical protein
VAEANGAIVGKDLVLISGFYNGYTNATAKNFALDITDPYAIWRQMDDHPVADGITHIALVVVGMKVYTCGGYVGGNPGLQTDQCFIYDHSIAPNTTGQWSTFRSLPDAGRAGAGMVYDSTRNALIFAGGATRPKKKIFAVDHNDTWVYSFANATAGWVKKANIPFIANHMSSVTAKDITGKEHHYFFGGQMGANETDGNVADNYEWDAQNETWIKQAPMLFPRGHTAASTRAISCGFIIAGGTTNGNGTLNKTKDISYYDIPSNTWTKIGDLPGGINTPVCDIKGGTIFCESGYATGSFSYKNQIA